MEGFFGLWVLLPVLCWVCCAVLIDSLVDCVEGSSVKYAFVPTVSPNCSRGGLSHFFLHRHWYWLLQRFLFMRWLVVRDIGQWLHLHRSSSPLFYEIFRRFRVLVWARSHVVSLLWPFAFMFLAISLFLVSTLELIVSMLVVTVEAETPFGLVVSVGCRSCFNGIQWDWGDVVGGA